jgi:hypothetical protein
VEREVYSGYTSVGWVWGGKKDWGGEKKILTP